MNAIPVLIWREYRELRGSVLGAVGILLVPPLAYLCCGQMRSAGDIVLATLMAYPIFAGTFFGMRAAAGERGGHTAAFLNAVPVHPVILGIVRLAATFVAVLLPLAALAAACASILSLYARDSLPTFPAAWLSTCMTWSLLVTCLVAACGLGAPSELKAAGRGLVGLVGCGLPLLVYRTLLGFSIPSLVDVLLFLGRLSTLLRPAIMIGLATAFVWRYRSAIGPLRVAGNRPSPGWIPARLRSLSGALFLKASCEGLPLLAAVMLAAIVLTFLLVTVRNFSGMIVGWGLFLMTAGAVAAMFTGIASFAADLDPRINTFWRSRPISPTRWFWTKYAVALGTLLVLLALPQIGLMARDITAEELRPRGLPAFNVVAAYWFGAFSAGVVAICLVRRPLSAGIFATGLSVALLWAIYGVNDFIYLDGFHFVNEFYTDDGIWYWPGGSDASKRMVFSFGAIPSAIVPGGIVVASIAATLAAWRAASRDIAIVR